MVRILLLNDDYPPTGHSSVASITCDLARKYAERGHDVRVITTHRSEDDPAIRRTDHCTSLPVSYRMALRSYLSLYHPRVTRMVRTEIEQIRPDVVHAHNIHQYLTYDALRVARRCTPRVFLTMHDVMSFSFARLATERFLATAGRDTRLTVRDHWNAAKLQYNPLRNVWIRTILRSSVRSVAAVSEHLREALLAHGIPRVVTIYNGVDLDRWHASPDEIEAFRLEQQLPRGPTVLFGGRISLDKGVEPLLRALTVLVPAFPSLTLLVVGDRGRFERIASSLRVPSSTLEHVRCLGWLSPSQMRTAYGAADIVTTPSLCLDCFPSTNLEAMAMRKPIVGTIFGGTPEAVTHGETGFVCDPRDEEAYVSSLRRILQNPALARQMGEAGRERVIRQFSIDRQAEAYLQLFSV